LIATYLRTHFPVKKATEGNAGDFKERTFEAYGFGGASLVISVLTDNDNRANADVRASVNKREGKMAESGSVLFMYDRRGIVEYKGQVDEEELLEAAIEQGVEDYEVLEGDEEGSTMVYTDPKEVSLVWEALKATGKPEEEMQMSLAYVSKAPVEVSEEDFDKNMEIIDVLESLDDVDSVEHNMSN
jgi:YebC/PmpR family DNA-binding regulatory protein